MTPGQLYDAGVLMRDFLQSTFPCGEMILQDLTLGQVASALEMIRNEVYDHDLVVRTDIMTCGRTVCTYTTASVVGRQVTLYTVHEKIPEDAS